MVEGERKRERVKAQETKQEVVTLFFEVWAVDSQIPTWCWSHSAQALQGTSENRSDLEKGNEGSECAEL